MADPAGRKGRQQMEAGPARTHLENCTGKHSETVRERGEDKIQAMNEDRHKSEEGLKSISIVLGMEERSRQDQANKSAGWMPRH